MGQISHQPAAIVGRVVEGGNAVEKAIELLLGLVLNTTLKQEDRRKEAYLSPTIHRRLTENHWPEQRGTTQSCD